MADSEQLNQDVKATAEHASESFGQLKDDAARIAQSAAGLGRQGVEQVKSKITDSTAAVKARLSDGTAAVKSRLNDGSEAAREAAERYRTKGNELLDQTKERIEQNPLQAVAIAAAVGVVVGVLLRR